MQILITGGAGFIGSHLAEACLSDGHSVTVLDDLSTGKLENIEHLTGTGNLRFVQASVCDKDAVTGLMEGKDQVYHLAASVGVRLILEKPLETMQNNIHGTECVLDAAAAQRVPVLIASSSEVYGRNPVPGRLKETDSMHIGQARRWGYGCSKLAGEFLAQAYSERYGMPVVIVRLFNVIGPRQSSLYGMVVPSFVSRALKHEKIEVHGDGTQTRTFVHVRDTVRAMRDLMRKPQGCAVYNIGGQEEISIATLAALVKKTTCSRSAIVNVPYEDTFGEGFEDIGRRLPDISRIEDATGFVAGISLEVAIQDIARSLSER
jgi:UDP-glucose 4-epimerase